MPKANMPLSQAMREGAKLHPQAFGKLRKSCGGSYCTCALGAALEATGVKPKGFTYNLLVEKFPFLMIYGQHTNGVVKTATNPMTGQPTLLRHVIANLNDTHKWTREAIADWLEEQGY